MRRRNVTVMIGIVVLLVAIAAVALFSSSGNARATPTALVGVPGVGATQFCHLDAKTLATPATGKDLPDLKSVIATACGNPSPTVR